MSHVDAARVWLTHCIGCGGEHVENLLAELERRAEKYRGRRARLVRHIDKQQTELNQLRAGIAAVALQAHARDEAFQGLVAQAAALNNEAALDLAATAAETMHGLAEALRRLAKGE